MIVKSNRKSMNFLDFEIVPYEKKPKKSESNLLGAIKNLRSKNDQVLATNVSVSSDGHDENDFTLDGNDLKPWKRESIRFYFGIDSKQLDIRSSIKCVLQHLKTEFSDFFPELFFIHVIANHTEGNKYLLKVNLTRGNSFVISKKRFY